MDRNQYGGNPILDIKQYKQWICWDLREGRKIPVNIWGQPSGSTHARDFVTFEEAKRAADEHGLMGPAFCFTADDPFIGLDLDDCLDERRQPYEWVMPILEQFDTYCELSPGLRGLKLYLQGELPSDIKHNVQIADGAIEIYSSGRFFAWSGINAGDCTEVRNCQAGIDWLCENYMQREKTIARPMVPIIGTSLHQRADDYVNNAELPLEGGRNNAAFRLAGHLLAMEGDNGEKLSLDEVKNYVRQWNLMLPKPMASTEVDRACESASRAGTPRAAKRSERAELPTINLVDPRKKLSVPVEEPPEEEMEACPGFIGDLTDYILRTSKYPQPELAVGAAITCLSVLTGRKVRSGRTRTNVYALAIAPSGAGKDYSRQVVKELLREIGAKKLSGPERFGSSAGLVKCLTLSPACWFPIDEIGRLIQTMQSPKSSHLYNIGTVLMQLYTSAGTNWIGDAYADEKRTPEIDDPHCVLYGSTVPGTLWEGLGRDAITGGLLGRCMLFEGDYVMPQKTIADEPLPGDLIGQAKWWFDFNPGGGNWAPEARDTPLTCGAKEMLDDHEYQIALKRRDESPFDAAIWSRVGERTAKLALLAACSRLAEEVSEDDLAWGKKLSNRMARRFQREIETHHVAVENEDEKTIKRVLQTIRENPGIPKPALTRKTQWIKGGKRVRDLVLLHLSESDQIEYSLNDSNQVIIFEK